VTGDCYAVDRGRPEGSLVGTEIGGAPVTDCRPEREKRDQRPGLWLGSAWRNPEETQLQAEIRHLSSMVHAAHQADEPCRPGAARLAQDQLCFAVEAWREKDMEGAWEHAYRAREQLARCLSDERLIAQAQTLRAEIRDKRRVSSWRQAAIEGLLKQLCESPQPCLSEPQREEYYEALHLRNQGVINQYRRLRIVRHQQLLLALLGAPALIASIILLADSTDEFADPQWKTGAYPCILAMLLGILGATVSAAQRSMTAPARRVPEMFAADIASLSRVPIGALTGLTVWLFTLGTVEDPTHFNAANMLLAAFGAGFAERLIVQWSSSPIVGSGGPPLAGQDAPAGAAPADPGGGRT
jgi:hypothetical protein